MINNYGVLAALGLSSDSRSYSYSDTKPRKYWANGPDHSILYDEDDKKIGSVHRLGKNSYSWTVYIFMGSDKSGKATTLQQAKLYVKQSIK